MGGGELFAALDPRLPQELSMMPTDALESEQAYLGFDLAKIRRREGDSPKALRILDGGQELPRPRDSPLLELQDDIRRKRPQILHFELDRPHVHSLYRERDGGPQSDVERESRGEGRRSERLPGRELLENVLGVLPRPVPVEPVRDEAK